MVGYNITSKLCSVLTKTSSVAFYNEPSRDYFIVI